MNQKEYFGFGSINNIKNILEELSTVKKVFLVTGKKSYSASGAKAKLQLLLKNYQVIHVDDFSPNPDTEDVLKVLNCYSDDIDIVIAVGGGSVLDMAKAVNILSANSGDILDYVTGTIGLKQKGKPLIAAATTTGSGSEATSFSVVYHKGEKFSLAHPGMLPDYSIIDPQLTMSMPTSVSAPSSLDALAQAIESYWSVSANDESRSYSKKALDLILKNIKDSINQPTIESRQAMAEGAHWAGKAVNIARTTVCHALSYAVTTLHELAHGHAVALTLGNALEYNAAVSTDDCVDERGAEKVQEAMNNLLSILGCRSAQEGNDKIKQIIRDVGLEASCRSLGYSEDDIQTFVDRVNLERLKNNPRAFKDRADLKSLFVV